jgi:dipeptidyl aminopeptidase/acylaminoacyl peptidase
MRLHVPALTFLLVAPLAAGRPLQVDDMFKVKRVADPQVSAKGDLAYQVGTVDMAANRAIPKIWLKRSGETAAKELDLGPGGQSRPRFSPDGSKLAYASGGQVWIVDLGTMERRQLTKLPGGADGHLWSPDGKWIAVSSATVPSGDLAATEAHLKAKAESKVKAHHAKTLMFRHWTEWYDPALRQHLFVVDAGSGAATDLTAGQDFDVPNFADVAAGDEMAWAPDSSRLAFGAHVEKAKADSTNGEIFEVTLADRKVRRVSSNPAMDTTPRYSPDGKYLAWRAQRRPGFEADKWELWIQDRATGALVRDTRAWDQSVGLFAWNGGSVVLASEKAGRMDLYRYEPQLDRTFKAWPQPVQTTRGWHVEAFALGAEGKVLFQHSDTATPADLYEADLKDGQVARVTAHNEAFAKELGLNRAEDFWFKGPAGKDGKARDVHALVVKPEGFDAARRYPVAFLVHGGPQGAWADAWSHRWNPQAWAGRGFLVVMVNPTGSTGYGQAYTDAISKDWNGVVMKELIGGLDAALKKYPNADPRRVVACGASYGGYAVNWLMGHHADRFAAFVSHAGIYNTESMQLATEELWFPKWEFGGWPWDSPATAARWRSQSPSTGAKNFKKPALVIHGELDYRVPYTEGIQLYQTLQLRGVPSEFLCFPDEGHWVLKPQNSKLWFETMLAWCERWTRP